jgi:hypothetical protein
MAAIYSMPVAFNTEENGMVIEGSWRTMTKENMTSLYSIRRVARKPPLNVKEIREVLATYFQN